MFLADADRVMLAGKRVRGIAHGDRRLLGFTNHALGPSFEALGGWAEIHRNFFLNPRPSGPLPVNHEISFGFEHPSANRDFTYANGAMSVIFSQASASPGDIFRFTHWGPNSRPVDDGGIYTLSFDAEFVGTTAEHWRFNRWLYDASGTNLNSSTIVPAVDPETGRLFITFQANDGGSVVERVAITLRGINIPLGGGISLTNARFSAGTDVRRLDGDYSPDPDMAPSWTGPANASPSILSIQAASGLSAAPGNGRKTFSSTQWASSGQRSLRVLREGDPGQAAGGAVIQSSWYPPPGVVTILATCHIPEGYDASEDISTGQAVSRGIFLLSALEKGYAQAPPVPGTYQLRITVDRESETIRLGGGGLMGQSVYWDDIAIVEGVYTGPYFDGDSPGGEWQGTPHASQSWIWHP